MDTEHRARLSEGISHQAIYQAVAQYLNQHYSERGVLVDIGCGAGDLWKFVSDRFDSYWGVDILQYPCFPEAGKFIQHNLEQGSIPLNTNFADLVVSVETIEHLENPRAFMRELVRIAKPGCMVIVTTPNQLNLLSKLTLLFKNQFNAFQESPGLYPAHITALLEIDLIRIGKELGLKQTSITYTHHGRIPCTRYHWPTQLRFHGRTFSDNIIFVGVK